MNNNCKQGVICKSPVLTMRNDIALIATITRIGAPDVSGSHLKESANRFSTRRSERP